MYVALILYQFLVAIKRYKTSSDYSFPLHLELNDLADGANEMLDLAYMR